MKRGFSLHDVLKKVKNDLFIFQLLLAILFPVSSFCQNWEIVNMSLPEGDTLGANIRINFINKQNGWISSSFRNKYNAIFKTTDGGNSWNKILNSNEEPHFILIYSSKPDFCLVWGGYYSHDPDIYITQDGGENWDTVKSNFYFGDKTYFFNQREGITLGERYRYFTSDGGYTWHQGEDSTNYFAPSDVDFVNDSLGWMVSFVNPFGFDVGYIANTTNGGKTWQYQDSASLMLYGIDFIDSLKGFAVGTNLWERAGVLYATIDGGKNWVKELLTGVGALWDIGFLDEKYGWITGRGKIFRTTDGGETWNLQNEGIPFNLNKLIILKEEKSAYIFGDDEDIKKHILLRADLSNLTSVKGNYNNSKSIILEQNYPNPFNPVTSIQYQITKASFVTLKVHDILGREVAALVNEEKAEGSYRVKFDGNNLSSGIYFYSIQAGEFKQVKKMILAK